MAHSEDGAVLLGALHRLFQDASGVSQLEFLNGGQLVGVLEVGLLRAVIGFIVLDFGVDTRLWLVVDPFAYEELVL